MCVCTYMCDFVVPLCGRENLKTLKKAHEEEPVENYLRNSIFGCDLQHGDQVDTFVRNEQFGLGEPDYLALGTEAPRWIAVKATQNG